LESGEDYVKGSWDDFLTKCYLGDQIKKNKMDGACSMNGRQVRCIQGFRGRSSVKRPLGRLRSRWQAYIKMDLQDVG
jgi:hypothetical protein